MVLSSRWVEVAGSPMSRTLGQLWMGLRENECCVSGWAPTPPQPTQPLWISVVFSSSVLESPCKQQLSIPVNFPDHRMTNGVIQSSGCDFSGLWQFWAHWHPTLWTDLLICGLDVARCCLYAGISVAGSDSDGWRGIWPPGKITMNYRATDPNNNVINEQIQQLHTYMYT